MSTRSRCIIVLWTSRRAFDTTWILWKMLRSIGVDPKIKSQIEAMYENVECAVVINGQMIVWLREETGLGVRQGCLLSPVLFLEFVMADLKSLCKEFKLDTNLSFDIRYADDTTIMSIVFEELQLSTEELQVACSKWGIKINLYKMITSLDKRIVQKGEELETVGEFCFLDSIEPCTQRERGRGRGRGRGRERERCQLMHSPSINSLW